MLTINLLQIGVGLLTGATIVVGIFAWNFNYKKNKIEIHDTQSEVVDQPTIISKIPENDEIDPSEEAVQNYHRSSA